MIFHHAKVSQVSAVLSPDKIHAITTLNTAFQLALMTGAVDKINDLTVQYTKEREQFGRPIHRFQLVQQHIVLLAGETAIALAAFNNVTEALLKTIKIVRLLTPAFVSKKLFKR